MAKGVNQKLKLLYIVQILQERTNEEYGISTAELITELGRFGVGAERKSIYNDIEQLRQFGYDIESSKEKEKGGYRLLSRTFELPELKLLVDSVQSSRFITQKKSRDLIKKLTGLASNHDAKQLNRQVYVAERIKTENESIYYNVDYIHRAIQENKQISFQYFAWNVDKEMQKKRNGDNYIVSPHILMWNDENYYLVGYDETAGILKHYRVDKMIHISILDEKRLGTELIDKFQPAKYSNRTFGMFGGREEIVTLRFPNYLAGVVIDRFGKDVEIRKVDDEYFISRMKIAVSNQFFGWLSGLGEGAVIQKPETVKEEYTRYLKSLINQYLIKGEE